MVGGDVPRVREDAEPVDRERAVVGAVLLDGDAAPEQLEAEEAADALLRLHDLCEGVVVAQVVVIITVIHTNSGRVRRRVEVRVGHDAELGVCAVERRLARHL